MPQMMEIAHCQLAGETKSIISPHRLSYVYDRESSVTFFYSDIEKCWIVIVNNGTVSINDSVLSSSGGNSYVIEHKAHIVFGTHRFVFYNINSPRGVSRVLVDSLLKSKKGKIKTERVLEIIQDCCGLYKDFYFVLDCIRKNGIFNYKCGELSLNIGALCEFVKAEESPLRGSLEYELEHGFRSRSMGKSFNVGKIWNSSDFGAATDQEPGVGTNEWPSLEALEAILKRRSNLDTDDVSKNSPVSCKIDPLPSPRSSCRYVNSYVINAASGDRRNQDSGYDTHNLGRGLEPCDASMEYRSLEPSTSTSAHSSDELYSTSEDSDQSASSSSKGEVIILKRRQEPETNNKRCKYHFELSNKPAVERLAVSGESDSSSMGFCSDTEIEKTRSRPKPHPRSASCVEDGFMCEKSSELLDDLLSHRKKNKRLYKIKALACYDAYKINKL